MSTKIRKQIYLEKRQNQLLKRLAEARGVSEAEVIRQAIDREAAQAPREELPPDRAAWESILASIRERAQTTTPGEPYKWNREEIYAEREERLFRHLNEPGPDTESPADKATPDSAA